MANFLSATANFEDFINMSSAEINGHVQKNNESVLKKAFNFFQGDSKILVISGFAGTGKKQIAEHSLSYLEKNTISMRYYCTPSTKLDDIQLSFYKTLRQKTSIKDTAELEAIEAISDKIEYFLTKTEFKFVPVFYNFDSIKDENKPDILNYIMSLSKKENIKSVICAKTFDTDLIPAELKYVKIMAKALSKEEFEKYIREFGIKVTPAMLDQLYRLTRGYFFSACICSKIMINQELTINDFIVMYTNSGEKFDLFLSKFYYKLIVGTTKSAFNLFVKLHHGLNIKVLQTIGSYPENIIKMLADNYYINKKGDLYYPSEFLKDQLDSIIDDEISHKRLASYYEKQLNLSPDERDFIVSRASLQDEIAFYKGIEITPPKTAESTENNDSHKDEQAEQKDQKEEKPKINYDDISTQDLFNKANEEFSKYEYLMTVELLTVILSRKDTIQGTELLYSTYKLLAETFKKLTKWQYALYYYELLERHYQNISDFDSMYLIQYEKATVYYSSYRIVDAIKLLKTLISLSNNNTIIMGANVLLGNIALSTSNKSVAIQHYEEGIKYADDTTPKGLRMELFFKYAVLSDENGDINNAVEYYQKCIEINDATSKYKALAYSNLADLFNENNLFSEAKECYQKAYDADKENGNEYGMYYSLSKIIPLTDKKEKDLLVKLSLEAKEHALKTDDYNALLLSIITLGDVYYDYPEPEKALEEYLSLYREGVEVIEEPNFSMIKSRIEDIRARIGKEKFEELVPDYD